MNNSVNHTHIDWVRIWQNQGKWRIFVNNSSYHMIQVLYRESNVCNKNMGSRKQGQIWFWFRFNVFYATLNNISVMSWRSVPDENHRPVASHWQTLSHNIVSTTCHHVGFELTTLVVIGTDCTGSCKSKYHATTTAPNQGQRR